MSLGVAVIGCGSIGAVHAEHYSAVRGARLVACVDIIPERARALADRWGAAHHGVDYKDVLARDDIQAVSVCLPNHLHCPVTLDALRAGKHVLCEKPVALTLDEARRMQSEARRGKRLLVIGVVNRFNDYVNLLKKTIESGAIGSVHHVSLMFKQYRSIPGLGGWFTTKSLAGGGVMIDWGVHFVDLAMYVLGFPKPRSVSGVTHAVLAREPRKYVYTNMWAGPPDYRGVCDVEEYAAGVLRTDGPTITFEGAWAQSVNEGVMHVDFHGDRGGIRLSYGKEFVQYGWKDGVLYENRPTLAQRNMYATEIESFVQCVTRGKPSPAAIETVVTTQAILDRFYASAAAGRELLFS